MKRVLIKCRWPDAFKERVAHDVAKWTKAVADAKISKVRGLATARIAVAPIFVGAIISHRG